MLESDGSIEQEQGHFAAALSITPSPPMSTLHSPYDVAGSSCGNEKRHSYGSVGSFGSSNIYNTNYQNNSTIQSSLDEDSEAGVNGDSDDDNSADSAESDDDKFDNSADSDEEILDSNASFYKSEKDEDSAVGDSALADDEDSAVGGSAQRDRSASSHSGDSASVTKETVTTTAMRSAKLRRNSGASSNGMKSMKSDSAKSSPAKSQKAAAAMKKSTKNNSMKSAMKTSPQTNSQGQRKRKPVEQKSPALSTSSMDKKRLNRDNTEGNTHNNAPPSATASAVASSSASPVEVVESELAGSNVTESEKKNVILRRATSTTSILDFIPVKTAANPRPSSAKSNQLANAASSSSSSSQVQNNANANVSATVAETTKKTSFKPPSRTNSIRPQSGKNVPNPQNKQAKPQNNQTTLDKFFNLPGFGKGANSTGARGISIGSGRSSNGSIGRLSTGSRKGGKGRGRFSSGRLSTGSARLSTGGLSTGSGRLSTGSIGSGGGSAGIPLGGAGKKPLFQPRPKLKGSPGASSSSANTQNNRAPRLSIPGSGGSSATGTLVTKSPGVLKPIPNPLLKGIPSAKASQTQTLSRDVRMREAYLQSQKKETKVSEKGGKDGPQKDKTDKVQPKGK